MSNRKIMVHTFMETGHGTINAIKVGNVTHQNLPSSTWLKKSSIDRKFKRNMRKETTFSEDLS